MSMIAKGYSVSVVGGREQNQDAFLVDNQRGLFAVADGVGGGLKGEVASRLAVEGLAGLPDGSSDLSGTFMAIQEAVLKESIETLGDALMGTTLTALLVVPSGDGVEGRICHVGDSRCYLYSGGHLRLLTLDHEAFDETMNVPVLASYMGIPTDIHPLQIHEEVAKAKAGDAFLLCTDGLYKQVNETRIAELITEKQDDPDALLKQLAEEAAKDPFSDNITVVFVRLQL